MIDEATNSEESFSEDETSLPESAEQSETQEAADDGQEQEAGEEKPRKPTAKDRIDELTRLRREAERDAEYWKAKALQAPPAQETVAPPVAEAAPNPEVYEAGEFDTRYIKDLARWEAKQETAQAIAELRAEQQQAQAQSEWDSRVRKASEEYPDFEEKVLLGAQRNAWACSPAVADAIRLSDKGTDIAYALASDPAEAARIHGLPPALQLIEVGKLEAKLIQPKPRTTTQAPIPTPQVRGSGGKFAVQPDTSDFAAFDKQYGNGS